jgi:hypothetical protein
VILLEMIHVVRAYVRCLLVFILVQGCAAEHVVSVRSSPTPGKQGVFHLSQNGMLYIQAVSESYGTLWYTSGFHSWILEQEPTEMVLKAVEEELKLMGICVTAEPFQAIPRLEIELRWFGPYGHSPLTAAIIIAFALYPAQSNNPVWRGKVQAGEYLNPAMVDVGEDAAFIGRIISKVLSDALMQLRWKPDFLDAISHVLQTSMKCGQREELG